MLPLLGVPLCTWHSDAILSGFAREIVERRPFYTRLAKGTSACAVCETFAEAEEIVEHLVYDTT